MTPAAKQALRAACDRLAGQRAVALRLGYSQTTVSLALRGQYMHDTNKLERAIRATFPDDVAAAEAGEADWLQALRAECRRTSQQQVADRLDLSEATVSQVLNGSYKAATTRIERRVRGGLLQQTCECPVMGEVRMDVCQELQELKAPRIGNLQRTEAWYACRGQGRTKATNTPCSHFNCGKKTAPSIGANLS